MKHLQVYKVNTLPLLITGFILLLFSCKKTLTEEPRAISTGNFYNTASEVEAAIGASYQQLRASNNISGQLGAQLETYADWIYAIGSYLPLKDYAGLNSVNIGRTDAGWNLFYLAIRNANIVIQSTTTSTSLSPAEATRFKAEARFLRAYCYFWLVRNWAGVPIRTEAELEEPNVARSSEDEVYSLIISDLQDAELNLPETQAQLGRATKWAAKSVLAHVYFTRGQYPEARDKSEEVMVSNRFSLVPVTVASDFLALFGPTVVSSAEEIWYLKMSRPNNQGNYLPVFFAYPASRLHANGAGFSAFYTDTVASRFHRTWPGGDLRKIYNWVSFNRGGGPFNVIFRKLYDSLGIGNFGAGNDMTLYRYADILLMYAEAASRANNGPTPAAVEALNKVHRRAYGQPVSTPWAGDYVISNYNNETFADLCIQERGYETQGEVKRWLDLKRLGLAKLNTYIRAEFNKDVAAKHLLWPIPAAELNFNTALDPVTDQNPGY